MSLIRRLLGSLTVAAYLPGQRRIPFLPRQELDALRDRRIRRMVLHAAEWVPFYRIWFAQLGVDPRSIRGAADLDRLPLLDRALVRSQPQLFRAAGPAARGAIPLLTSGSTGARLQVHHDRRSVLANIAYGERERAPIIRICGGSFRPTELYVGYDTSTFKEVTSFYRGNVLFPVKPRRRMVSFTEPVEKIAEMVNTDRPDILSGYGGWIDQFFKIVQARRIALRPPKMVIYMGEALPPGGRDFINRHFGIPIISRYNAVESFKIGFNCERQTGFHVHEDLCHLRVVGSDGQSLPAGEPGRLVISNLVNRATVLLNYPIGDLAARSDLECSCGRTLGLLSELEGRAEDILPLPDGRFLHPRAIWQVFKYDRAVLQYQLIQHEPRRFELKLLTADQASFDQAVGRGLAELKAVLGPDARIDASYQQDLQQGLTGKYRPVISRCARPAA